MSAATQPNPKVLGGLRKRRPSWAAGDAKPTATLTATATATATNPGLKPAVKQGTGTASPGNASTEDRPTSASCPTWPRRSKRRRKTGAAATSAATSAATTGAITDAAPMAIITTSTPIAPLASTIPLATRLSSEFATSVIAESHCPVCMRVRMGMVYYTPQCTKHPVCLTCALADIDTSVIHLQRQRAQRLNVLAHDDGLFALVPRAKESSASQPRGCPLCRAGTLDLMGRGLVAVTAVHAAATRHALQTMGDLDNSNHEYQAELLAESKHGDHCPFCLVAPPVCNVTGLAQAGSFILNHVFGCPKRWFKCPFGDCSKSFSWANVLKSTTTTPTATATTTDDTYWWKLLNEAFQEHMRSNECQHKHACTYHGCAKQPPMPIALALAHDRHHTLVHDAVNKHLVADLSASLRNLDQATHSLMLAQIGRLTTLASTTTATLSSATHGLGSTGSTDTTNTNGAGPNGSGGSTTNTNSTGGIMTQWTAERMADCGPRLRAATLAIDALCLLFASLAKPPESKVAIPTNNGNPSALPPPIGFCDVISNSSSSSSSSNNNPVIFSPLSTPAQRLIMSPPSSPLRCSGPRPLLHA